MPTTSHTKSFDTFDSRYASVKLYKNACLTTGLFFILFAAIKLIYANLDIHHIVYFATGIIFLLIHLFYPSDKFKIINNRLLFYSFSFLVLNIGFLFEGGLYSPILYLIFPFVLLIIHLTNRKATNYLISFIITNLSFLFFMNYINPSISDIVRNGYFHLIKNASFIFAILTSSYVFSSIISKHITEKNKAKESEQAKEAFLANMSHLIRTPLNGINGYADFLMYDDISDIEKEAFKKRILINARELHHMIYNLIDLSILQEKKLKLMIDQFDIEELIDSIIFKTKYEIELSEKNISREFHIAENLKGLKLYNDADRLFQVIWNIIDNCIQHNSHIHFEVKFKTDEQMNNMIINISDNGVGINKETLKLISENNLLPKNNIIEANPKPGMGINISKGILDCMDGRITISSQLNHGTNVLIKVPLTLKPTHEK